MTHGTKTYPFRSAILTFIAVAVVVAAFAQSARTPGFLSKPATKALPGEKSSPEFTFVRVVYTGLHGWGYYKNWYTDWPKADRQFILGLQRLTTIRVADQGKAIQLTDKEIFRYPFIYSVEVGHWNLTDEESRALQEYLYRGGFLFCDDFWGSAEWQNFQRNLSRVLPGRKIVDIPLDHPIFHCYYDISQIIQIPNVGYALYRTTTFEEDGFVPYCRGVFDDSGRLMVVINWNTDLGDAWEWADLPGFPAKYSTYAYQIGINAIVYAMSH